MTAAIVYSDTRTPYEPLVGTGLADADRNTIRGWLVDGDLWDRIREGNIR